MFENFEPYKIEKTPPFLSISAIGVAFSKTAVARLENPKYVIVLIDEEKKQVALKTCEKNDKYAMPFGKQDKLSSVRCNVRDLVKTLFEMIDGDLKTQRYRIEGEYIKEEHALLFDFKNAKSMKLKERKS